MRRIGPPFGLLLLTALGLASGRPAQAQEPADRAWSEGDLTTADRLYAARLEADPRDQRALHRLALIRAWEGRIEESLALFERLLSLAPGNVEAARDRARVLAWDGELEASRAAYEAILAGRPEDTEARLGLAQVHLWAGRFEEAEALYEEVLDGNPRDPAALEGYASAAAWADRLGEAERRWGAALEAIPDHAPFRLGLSRTLLWQGRPAAALEVLDEARRRHPDDAGLAREHAELARRFEPLVRGEVAFERDSDGNRVVESSASGEWHPTARLSTTIGVVSRRAEDRTVEGRATRLSTGVGMAIEPGWELRAGAGLNVDDGGETEPVVAAGFSTPGRSAIRASLDGSHGPLSATARSIERAVTVTEVDATLTGRMGGGWRFAGSASVAEFRGRRSNQRLAGRVGLARRLPAGWSIDGSVRALGFESDLDDGYFDPGRFLLAEIGPGWSGEGKVWSLEAQAAIGVQRVEDEDPAPTVRTEGTAVFQLGQGEIVVRGSFATAALTAFSTGEADYRFGRVGVGSRWRF